MRAATPPLPLSLALLLVAQTAAADCEVEYKAKRDTPFELFYEVTMVDAPCNSAERVLRAKLASRGLTLLKILSKRDK